MIYESNFVFVKMYLHAYEMLYQFFLKKKNVTVIKDQISERSNVINNMTNVISCVIVKKMISTNLMFSHPMSNYYFEIATTSEEEISVFEH